MNPFENDKDFRVLAEMFYWKFKNAGFDIEDYDYENEGFIEAIKEHLNDMFNIDELAYRISGYCKAKEQNLP